MFGTHRIRLTLVWTTLVGSLVAQSRRVEPTTLDTAGVYRAQGELRGVAPSYRARFLPGAVELTPALGTTAPGDLSQRIVLETIERHGAVLYRSDAVPAPAFAPTPAPAPEPEHEGARGRVTYRRGPSVVERYDVRGDGLELSYVFAERPAGTGDLVVRVRLDGALEPVERGDCRTVRMRAAALDCVHWGPITGIDAVGRRAAGHYAAGERHLELRLPGAFVDRASYPLVLDPLISGLIPLNGNQEGTAPAAAYDQASDVYLVAFAVRTSALNSDVFAARFDRGGNPLGIVPVANSFELESHPAVADVAGSGRFLIAWQQATTPFGPWDVHGRAMTAATGSQSGPVAIAATAAQEVEPVAASGAGPNDDAAVLAWRAAGNGIRAAAVTVPATGDPVPGSAAVVSSDPTDTDCSVSSSGGMSGRFVVVWAHDPGTAPVEIRARALDRAANPLGAAVTAAADASFDLGHPDVDGDGTSFLAVYDRVDSDPTSRDCLAAKLVWTGTTLAPDPPFALSVGPRDDREPRVGWLKTKYLAVWTHRRTTAGRMEVCHAALSTLDCAACGTSGVVADLRAIVAGLDVAPQSAGGTAGDEALIVFALGDTVPPFASSLRGAIFDAMVGGPITTVAPGCGNGGQAGVDGPFALGNHELHFTLTGADPAATQAALSLSIPSAPFGCGACQLLVPLAQVPATLAGGTARSAFPLPCDPSLLDAELDFQWLVLGVPGAVCPLAPGLAASDWRRAQLAR